MSVLSDKWIKQAAKTRGMIKPFVSKQVRKGKISFGLSSYGYDARVSNEFKIFTNVNSGIVDPKGHSLSHIYHRHYQRRFEQDLFYFGDIVAY